MPIHEAVAETSGAPPASKHAEEKILGSAEACLSSCFKPAKSNAARLPECRQRYRMPPRFEMPAHVAVVIPAPSAGTFSCPIARGQSAGRVGRFAASAAGGSHIVTSLQKCLPEF